MTWPVHALLLRVKDVQHGMFERIGIATDLEDRDSFDNEVSSSLLADLDKDVKEHLPCLLYPDGWHTIRIFNSRDY